MRLLRRGVFRTASRRLVLAVTAVALLTVLAVSALITVSSMGGDGASLASFAPRGDTWAATRGETRSVQPGSAPVTALPGAPACSRPATDETGDARKDPVDIDDLLPGVVRIVTPAGSASGFVVDESGLIVTGRQPIENVGRLAVKLSTGDTYGARTIGFLGEASVAFIEIRSEAELTPLVIGNHDDVCAGDQVFSVGFPEGEASDIPAPAISKARVLVSGEGYIRTDAQLIPGYVGGPLLNESGQVVGVNAGGIMVRGGSLLSGVNFAIPVNEGMLLEAKDLEPPLRAGPGSLPTAPASTAVPTPAAAATPTPAATPQPTPRATSTIVPQPTPTPVVVPTATPIPTATPRPTATRRPTPTRRATSTPRPTATPTEAPTPTPTPRAVTTRFNNSEAGYRLEHPAGWNLRAEDPEEVVVSPGTGSASYVGISVDDVFSDWSLGEYFEWHRERVARQASNWRLFEQVTPHGEYRDGINYVHWEYRRQRTDGDCIESVVSHLYRSRFFPARQKGFAITMSICEGELERYGPVREAVLESFLEFQTP